MTRAPWSSSGERPCTYTTGVASAVPASMTGDHGDVTPSDAKVVTTRRIRSTLTTETGRRRQQRKEGEEVKIRPRGRIGDRRVRGAVGPVRAKDRGACQRGEDDYGHPHHVLPRGDGEERHAVPLDLILVTLPVCLPIDHAPRHRPLVDPESQDQPEVQTGERDEHPGDHEDVEREEPRQRPAGDDRPSQEHVDQRRPDNRRTRGDRCADPEPPVGVLIPPEDLPSEGHAERAQEEEDPSDPRQLARVFVGAEEEDLQHVQGHHEHHAVGAPEVNGAEIPPERRLLVQILKALVGLVGRGDVHEGKTDPGYALQREEGERGAPEHVPPARGSPRNRMGDGGCERLGEPRSDLKPPDDRAERAREFRHHHQTGPASVGSWPPRTRSWPSRISYSYSKSPRGGGPEAREPSS